MTDVGESLVGSYLRQVRTCDLVLYNEFTGDQGEIDVVGIKFGSRATVWLCEVATHLDGLNYGGGFAADKRKIEDKVRRALSFGARVFPDHMLKVEIWAPRVAVGQMTSWMSDFALQQSEQGRDVTFVVNGDYAAAVQELLDVARRSTSTTSEPAFRLLQILTHVRGPLRL
jgi:hypothetical protein